MSSRPAEADLADLCLTAMREAEYVLERARRFVPANDYLASEAIGCGSTLRAAIQRVESASRPSPAVRS